MLGLDPCTDSSISPTVNTGPSPSPSVEGEETETCESVNEMEAPLEFKLRMVKSSEK